MIKKSSTQVLIAKVKERYSLSLGQLSEILNVPMGTVCVAASGRRNLPEDKLELLQNMLDHAAEPVKTVFPEKVTFPGYVVAALKLDLTRLESQRSGVEFKLQKMMEDYKRIHITRDNLNRQHIAMSKVKAPARLINTLNRHALIQDIRIDRVDLHHIVKLRAVLAGLESEIATIKSALAKKSL